MSNRNEWDQEEDGMSVLNEKTTFQEVETEAIKEEINANNGSSTLSQFNSDTNSGVSAVKEETEEKEQEDKKEIVKTDSGSSKKSLATALLLGLVGVGGYFGYQYYEQTQLDNYEQPEVEKVSPNVQNVEEKQDVKETPAKESTNKEEIVFDFNEPKEDKVEKQPEFVLEEKVEQKDITFETQEDPKQETPNQSERNVAETNIQSDMENSKQPETLEVEETKSENVFDAQQNEATKGRVGISENEVEKSTKSEPTLQISQPKVENTEQVELSSVEKQLEQVSQAINGLASNTQKGFIAVHQNFERIQAVENQRAAIISNLLKENENLKSRVAKLEEKTQDLDDRKLDKTEFTKEFGDFEKRILELTSNVKTIEAKAKEVVKQPIKQVKPAVRPAIINKQPAKPVVKTAPKSVVKAEPVITTSEGIKIKPQAVKIRSILNDTAWVSDSTGKTYTYTVGDKLMGRQIGAINSRTGIYDTQGNKILDLPY